MNRTAFLIEPIDIVLPVHNEGASIEVTLREFYAQTLKDKIPIRFIICEDGSTDNTVDVLKSLVSQLPILLISGCERKGYSKAVIDGFRASTNSWIGFIDSDGQCDPKDLKTFVEKSQEGFDFVLGYRNPRLDHWIRIVMSNSFKLVYRMLFPVAFKDPSCPYLLISRPLLENVLSGKVGILKQGFWWEFLARVQTLNPTVCEIPVSHRPRSAGESQVYRPSKVPRIAIEHLKGLFTLRKELKQVRNVHV